MTSQGSSNIDLTLISEALVSSVGEWRVSDVCTTSDHNLITFTICQRSSQQIKLYKQDIYNIKRANWNKFSQLVEVNFDDNVTQKLKSLDKTVELFSRVLEGICKDCIPKKSKGRRTVPSPSLDISRLQREANKAKKQLTRARRLALTDNLQDFEATYRTARNKLVREIKKSKKETWQEFVTVEDNKDSTV